MAITFIDFTSGSFSNAVSGSFTLPAGFQANDIGVFWWYSRDSARTYNKPADVTQKLEDSDTGRGKLFVGYRVLQSSDTTFPWTCSSSASQDIIFGVSVFRGASTSGDPFENDYGGVAQKTTAEDVNPNSVTVTNVNACAVIINGKTNDGSVNTYPTGYVTAGTKTSAAGNDAGTYVCYKIVTSAGTEDPGNWDFGSAAGDGNLTWAGVLSPGTPAGSGVAGLVGSGSSASVYVKVGVAVAGTTAAGDAWSIFAEVSRGIVGTVGKGVSQKIAAGGGVTTNKTGFGEVHPFSFGNKIVTHVGATTIKAGRGIVGLTAISTSGQTTQPRGVSIAIGQSILTAYPEWTRVDDGA